LMFICAKAAGNRPPQIAGSGTKGAAQLASKRQAANAVGNL